MSDKMNGLQIVDHLKNKNSVTLSLAIQPDGDLPDDLKAAVGRNRDALIDALAFNHVMKRITEAAGGQIHYREMIIESLREWFGFGIEAPKAEAQENPASD